MIIKEGGKKNSLKILTSVRHLIAYNASGERSVNALNGVFGVRGVYGVFG